MHTRPFTARNWLIALSLGLAVAALQFLHGQALGHSVLMQSFNWLFDFDTSRFVGGWCTPGADAAQDLGLSFVARHALSLATRPACLTLLPLAGSPQTALMLLTALCAGATAAVAYGYAAAQCEHEFDRVLLALGYAVSVHPLMLGVIPETYGFALLGIGVHFLVLARAETQRASRFGRGLSLVLNLGFTLTNAALNVLSSVVLAWQTQPWRRWLRAEARLWLGAAGALLAIFVVSAAIYTPTVLAEIGGAPKAVWWVVNINRGEPATAWMVACTFVIYSFVAPVFTVINLPDPDLHPMLDFRAFDFSPVGWVALVLWALALGYGIRQAWANPATRRLALVALLWVLMNIVLHSYWQYRGSVYLYGAHTSFALFTLLALGYASALQRHTLRHVRIAAAVFLGLVALNNFGIYTAMIDFILRQPL